MGCEYVNERGFYKMEKKRNLFLCVLHNRNLSAFSDWFRCPAGCAQLLALHDVNC